MARPKRNARDKPVSEAQLTLGLEQPAAPHPAAGVPIVPTGEHETSLRAAHQLSRSNEHKTLERIVFDAIQAEPRNDFELQRDLGLSGDTLRPRRWSLQRRGLVEDSGTTRKAKRGQAIVWCVTEGETWRKA